MNRILLTIKKPSDVGMAIASCGLTKDSFPAIIVVDNGLVQLPTYIADSDALAQWLNGIIFFNQLVANSPQLIGPKDDRWNERLNPAHYLFGFLSAAYRYGDDGQGRPVELAKKMYEHYPDQVKTLATFLALLGDHSDVEWLGQTDADE